MKKAIYVAMSAAVMLAACKGAKVTPPEDPTNEDAIYNIIRYDRQLEFNLDLFDPAIPDTTELALAAPYRPLHFWRKVDADSLFIGIDIDYPEEGDTVGTVPRADVSVFKTFWGTFEVIAEDTSGGGSERIRMSKPFTMQGRIDAFFEKVGFDYNTRRGWILRSISDATFGRGPGSALTVWPQGIGGIELRPEDGPAITIDPELKPLGDVPSFSRSESLTVYVHVTRSDDHVTIRHASGDSYVTRHPARLDSLTYYQGFRLPPYVEFNHILVDVIANSAVADTFPYRPDALGVLYRVR